MPFTICCLLFVICCLPFAVCCLPSAVCRLLFAVHRLLFTVCNLHITVCLPMFLIFIQYYFIPGLPIQTYINADINRHYYRFIDVPGVFYYSILKNSNMSNRFKSVEELRSYLSRMVLRLYDNDELLQKIFRSYRIDYKSWCTYITNMHEWAKQMDILVLSYITKLNVISVG